MNKRRILRAELLEGRRVLAASLGWDGPGAGSAELSYYIGDAPGTVTQAEFESAIEQALDVWSDVVDIEFTPTQQPGLTDSLDFTSRPLDGRGGTLAQAYFPDDINPARIAGDVQFDSADAWEIGNDLGSRAFDLVAVAVHEIGHALGLDHSQESSSILAPSISPNVQFTELSQGDVEEIQQLYAPAIGSTNTLDPAIQEQDNTSPLRFRFFNLFETRDPEPAAEETPAFAFRWTVNLGNFSPTPFGRFGAWLGNSEGARGIAAAFSPAFNFERPHDVNGDNSVSAVDALITLNAVNNGHSVEDVSHHCDTNGDGTLSAIDVLGVINTLNAPESEPGNVTEIPAAPEAAADEADFEAELDAIEFGEFDSEMAEEIYGAGLHHNGILGSAIDRLFENFDANDDDSLTEDEVPDFMWRFMTREGVDADGDNEITLAEIDQALANQRLELFNQVDDNNDGVWTEGEIPTFAWRRLENADTNSDNGVSFDELEAFRELSRFERLDDNGDGNLTSDEVSERAWERLSRFDANEDGIVTSDELPQPRERFQTRFESRVSRMAEVAANVFRFVQRFR